MIKLFLNICLFSFFVNTTYSQNEIMTSTNNEVFLTNEGKVLGYIKNTYEWERPYQWPIGSGYTEDSWLVPETNVLKYITVGSKNEHITVTLNVAGRYFVDWYGDGSVISNYVSGTIARYTYPESYIGKYIPIIIRTYGTTNFVNWTGFGGSVIAFGTSQDAKYPKAVEVICPYGVYGTSFQNSWHGLESVIANAANGCYCVSAFTLKNIDVGEICTKIGDTAFYATAQCYSFKNLNNVTNFGASSFFQSGIRALVAPKCEKIGNSAFGNCYALSSLSPMPKLSVVGTDIFKYCNLNYETITNFVLALPTVSPSQTISFSGNPGSIEFGSWYTNGLALSPSNTVIGTKGWYVLWQ